MSKKQIAGIIIFAVLVGVIILFWTKKGDDEIEVKDLTTVFVATGGGKEAFLADEDVQKIFKEKYKLNVIFDSWSNGKTVKVPLIRESIGLGNESIIQNASSYSINSPEATKYDVLFTSDQRFYDYYKVSPNKDAGEADRYTVVDGGLTLNTPIVIYTWAKVVDALIKEQVVTEKDGIYYIADMTKLMNYILEGKKWSDIGLSELYGIVNIASTDPVTSSPGATYYGLLLSILSESQVNSENVEKNLPKLREFYLKSGYMNNTPADLFERYLKTGMGGEPMIVDYEKSMIDFAISNKDGFAQVKDQVRILYPTPTIWNSHCLTIFTENGEKLFKAFEDKDIQQLAWERYGFRTGVSGSGYDVSSLGLSVPQNITSTVSSLKMDTYNQLINYLKESNN